jgi:hypothetical protein
VIDVKKLKKAVHMALSYREAGYSPGWLWYLYSQL